MEIPFIYALHYVVGFSPASFRVIDGAVVMPYLAYPKTTKALPLFHPCGSSTAPVRISDNVQISIRALNRICGQNGYGGNT